ncbi:MAG: PAS domain S-box protein [Gemmataceae bacterium]|nr:PAS domain S-box protein [Gemmataceae bacterium]
MTTPSPTVTLPSEVDPSLYSAVYEHAPDGILLLSNERRCLDANLAARELLGYSRDELLQRTLDDLTVPADRAQIPGCWQDFLNRQRCKGLWRALTRPGNTLYADTRCQAHIRPGIHLCLFRDVSTYLQVENENQLLRQVLEALPLGLLLSELRSAEERIVYVNAAATQLSGYRQEELLGQQIGCVDELWLDQPALERVRVSVRQGQAVWIETVLRRKNGSHCQAWIAVTPLRNTDGVISHCLYLALDVVGIRGCLTHSTPGATLHSPDSAAEKDPPVTTRVPAPSPHHILVVEDEDAVREFVRLVLVQAGYTVTLARDGEEAWQLFQTHPERFDLILSDVLMPRRNGAELAALVRTVRPSMPMVFISGYTGGTILNLQLTPPMDTLLEKPFSIDKLLQAVRAALSIETSSAAPITGS